MTLEVLFSSASTVALAGWLALLVSPFAPRLCDRIAGIAVPLVLAVAYTAIIAAYWHRAEGGFDSLANVMRLFGRPELVLAGWIHYLAFDLLVGAWEVRTARQERIPHVAVIPCLMLTFIFGPVGFLVFSGVRAGRRLLRGQQGTA